MTAHNCCERLSFPSKLTVSRAASKGQFMAADVRKQADLRNNGLCTTLPPRANDENSSCQRQHQKQHPEFALRGQAARNLKARGPTDVLPTSHTMPVVINLRNSEWSNPEPEAVQPSRNSTPSLHQVCINRSKLCRPLRVVGFAGRVLGASAAETGPTELPYKKLGKHIKQSQVGPNSAYNLL